MRLCSAALATLVALSAPALARSQGPSPSETFSSIVQTYQFSGCGSPSIPPDIGFPCAGGFATYGLLRAGSGYGIQFDVVGDFTNPPAFLAVSEITRLDLTPYASSFVFSTASTRDQCFDVYADGRCVIQPATLGTITGSFDARGGRTVTVVREFGVLTSAPLVSDPGSFRLEYLRIDYDYSARDQYGPYTGSLRVVPSFTLVPSVTVAPEPATLALTAAGLGLVGAAARRRRA